MYLLSVANIVHLRSIHVVAVLVCSFLVFHCMTIPPFIHSMTGGLLRFPSILLVF